MTAPAARDVAPASRALALAALAWLAYALLHVLVAGVVLDESVLPAQIITGHTVYPSGHPHEVFYWRAPSLSHYASAVLFAAVPDVDFVSATRNVLFLFASAYAAFATTFVLTRSALWSHAAVALALLGAHIPFAGVYPMWTFPSYYSNGHLGLQAGLVTVALLLAGARTTPAFLLGILPTIHGTLALPVLAWSGLFVWWKRGALAGLRWLGWPLACGAAVSAAVVVATLVLPPAWVPHEPFVGDGDATRIREAFRVLTDPHRGPYDLASLGYAGNLAAFAALGVVLAALQRRTPAADAPRREAVWGLLALGGAAWAIVLGARLADAAGVLPDALQIAMPARFSNYTATLLLPFGVAVAARASERASATDRLGAFLAAALVIAGGAAFRLRLGTGSPAEIAHWSLAFGFLGVAFGIALVLAPRARVAVAISVAALGAVLVLVAGPKASPLRFPLGVVAGAVALLALRWLAPRLPASLPARLGSGALALAVAAAAAASLPGRLEDHEGRLRWDRVDADDLRLREWLDRNARPDELLLSFTVPRAELQAKTGRPVLLELETLWLMTYMPPLAPAVARMTRDLYGVDYARPERLAHACEDGRVTTWCPLWADVWKQRSPDEWRSLGRRYDFRFVVAPVEVPLALERVVAGDRFVLYRVGAEGAPGGQPRSRSAE